MADEARNEARNEVRNEVRKVYIEREAILNILQEELSFNNCIRTKEQNKFLHKGIKIAIRHIGITPAADVVEVKRGEWIAKRNPWVDNCYVCSICGTQISFLGSKPKFCPHCGADMRGSNNG